MSILAVNTNGFPLTVVKVLPRNADTIVATFYCLVLKELLQCSD